MKMGVGGWDGWERDDVFVRPKDIYTPSQAELDEMQRKAEARRLSGIAYCRRHEQSEKGVVDGYCKTARLQKTTVKHLDHFMTGLLGVLGVIAVGGVLWICGLVAYGIWTHLNWWWLFWPVVGIIACVTLWSIGVAMAGAWERRYPHKAWKKIQKLGRRGR
jgi:hypothetical protein